MRDQTKEYGGLTCRVIDTLADDLAPEIVVVVCHGFGAPGTDLVSLGSELLHAFPDLQDRVQFVFPAAPISLASVGMPGGRAWWHLDIAQMTASIESGENRILREEYPEELPVAGQHITSLIEELRDEHGIDYSKLALAGFSQGSMLMTDTALRLPTPPGLLCVWSGSLLCEDDWRELASKRGSLKVLQSHGRIDPILPFEGAVWLRELFLENDFDAEFIAFNGVHTIPPDALWRFGQLLIEL